MEPNSALKRLEKLVGTWELVGRTFDSKEDNIKGQVTIEWILDGFFLLQKGTMEMTDMKIQSWAIIGYDEKTDTFPEYVYESMGSKPLSYTWNIKGNNVTHWTKGAKYTGTFSEDGKILKGSWKAEGTEKTAANTYDATMIKVK